MTNPARAGGSAVRRSLVGLLIVVAIGVGVGLGALVASLVRDPEGIAGGPAAASLTAGPTPAGEPGPTQEPTPSATPEPTPAPTPALVPAPLTGLLVTPAAAAFHPIAVMIDDHRAARPQSGFNAASVVWHAPAEGGIPRYMLVFQERVAGEVGPVRSVRQYFIDWAAEWNAVLVHVGGEPQALANLRSQAQGELVWNVEERLYEGTYLWRSADRRVPHNVYSDGEHLRQVGAVVGAQDGPITPAWAFGPGLREPARPVGTTLTVVYPYETITYRFDAIANRYPRFIDGAAEPQVDGADGQVVAPANVVILRMPFGPLDDGRPDKDRLEAADVGEGEAIISTNGRIIRGTWSKASISSPTLLFDAGGDPVVLTRGQTFVQVIRPEYPFELIRGANPPSLEGGPS